jgi:shikimate kinase
VTRHLALVGVMGAGKTSVGLECAERLGRPLVDTDSLVVEAAGASVAGIFSGEGEAGFRRRERAAVETACAWPVPAVVSCGGGAILDPNNRRVLRERCVVVWLTATPEVLADRLQGSTDRPLLQGAVHPAARISALLRDRHDAYAAAAHVDVDASGPVEAVADAVLAAYHRLGATLSPPPTRGPSAGATR